MVWVFPICLQDLVFRIARDWESAADDGRRKLLDGRLHLSKTK